MKGILWAVIQSEVIVAERFLSLRRDRRSVECLPKDCRSNIPRLYPCGQPHHITLRYDVYRSRWRWLEGLRFSAIAHRVAHNERIQAIAVSLPWWIRWVCQNAHPHITVSWVENAEPVESNEMLARALQGFDVTLRHSSTGSTTAQGGDAQPNVELVRFRVQCQIQFKPFEK